MKQKIVLIVAVVAALLAAFLTRTYLSAKDAEVTRIKNRFYERHGLVDALCYARDMPAGSVITRADLKIRTVPASGLRGQSLTESDLGAIANRRILLGHHKGDLVFWGDIEGGNPASGGLAGIVRKNMRAVSINASGAQSVSGMVKPNDHVDVIGSFSFPVAAGNGRERAELVTCTILQNVLVLATGRQTSKVYLGEAQSGYSTVTLEVTPREAEMLVFAEQMKGRLSLTLRNRNDTSYEKELPSIDFKAIKGEIEELNLKRQSSVVGH